MLNVQRRHLRSRLFEALANQRSSLPGSQSQRSVSHQRVSGTWPGQSYVWSAAKCWRTAWMFITGVSEDVRLEKSARLQAYGTTFTRRICGKEASNRTGCVRGWILAEGWIPVEASSECILPFPGPRRIEREDPSQPGISQDSLCARGFFWAHSSDISDWWWQIAS